MMRRTLAILLVCRALYGDLLAPTDTPEPGSRLVLSVTGAIRRALAENPRVKSAKEAHQIAHLNQALSVGAFDLSWEPTCRLGLQSQGGTLAMGISFSKTLPTGTQFKAKPELTCKAGLVRSTLSLGFQQPLFRGSSPLVNAAPLQTANFQVRSQSRQAWILQQQIALQTVRSLYQLGLRRTQLLLEEEWCQHLEHFVIATRLKAHIGGELGTQLLKSDIQRRKAEQKRALAAQRADDALAELCTLLALPTELDIEVEAPFFDFPSLPSEEELWDITLEKRVEIQQAEDQLAHAHRQVRLARHNLLPEIKLECRAHQTDWTVELTSGTSWRRDSERVALQRNLIAADAAERALQETTQSLCQEVTATLRKISHAQERVLAGQERHHSATSRLRLTQLRLGHGKGDSFDLLQAEEGVWEAQQELLSAQVELTLSQYELLAAQGLLATVGGL